MLVVRSGAAKSRRSSGQAPTGSPEDAWIQGPLYGKSAAVEALWCRTISAFNFLPNVMFILHLKATTAETFSFTQMFN